MARRRSKYRSNNQTRNYSYSPVPSRRLRSVYTINLSSYNDAFVNSRRTYKPTYTSTRILNNIRKNNSTARLSTFSTPKRLKKNNTIPLLYSATPAQIRRARICIARKTRTEIMHATRKAGVSGQKKPRITPQSKIKC